MIRFCALFSLAVAVITTTSCDSHTWEKTQVLHEKYGAHGPAAGDHGAAKDTHAAPAAHGDKPAEHAPAKAAH